MPATSRVDGCPFGILHGSVIMPDLKGRFLLQHVRKMANGHSLMVSRAKRNRLVAGWHPGGSSKRPSLERHMGPSFVAHWRM